MAKKPTILLVDDDPDIREFVTFNLAKEGYNVVTAKDGAEGVEAVKKHRPDLVLLDVMMPGMDGIEACEAIRTNPDIASTLIAFLSARGEDYSQVAGFDAGADDYITKPMRAKVLVSRVKALLRRNVKESQPVGNIERGDLLINLEKYQVYLKGNLIATKDVKAGANADVRIPTGGALVTDVVAVLRVGDQIVDQRVIDVR